MAGRSPESERALRIAIVGAPTEAGAMLREALAARHVSGARVDLYGTTLGEVVLGEYAGEARMIQEPSLDEVAAHGLIFLCERGEFATRVAQVATESVIIDLEEGLSGGSGARCVPLDLEREIPRAGGRFVVPHPLALALGEILHPVQRRFGIGEALAVVMRPAADFGREAVEELRLQTVQLLSFGDVPIERLGRQLAFKVVPDDEIAAGSRDLGLRIAREVQELLGWPEPRCSVALLAVPVFHGHAIQIRLRCLEPVTIDDLREVLARHAPADTNRSQPADDGLGGFWLWCVADELGEGRARQAVRLAERVVSL